MGEAFSQGCNQGISQAMFSSEGLTRKESNAKLTEVFCRNFPCACMIEAFFVWLVVVCGLFSVLKVCLLLLARCCPPQSIHNKTVIVQSLQENLFQVTLLRQSLI